MAGAMSLFKKKVLNDYGLTSQRMIVHKGRSHRKKKT